MNSDKKHFSSIGFSKKEKITLLLGSLGIVFMVVYLILTWDKMPELIPKHFDGAGNPDSWGKKGGLFMLPIISFILYLSLVILSFFPHVYNYAVKITEENLDFQYHNARELLLYLNLEIQLALSYIYFKTIKVSLREATGLGLGFLPVFLIAIFGTLGYKIFKMRKNK